MSLDATIDALIPDWPKLGAAQRAEIGAHCAGFVRAQLRLAPFRGVGLLTSLGSQIAFAEGRCVGGGTEINSAIFQRAPERVIGEWAEANRLKDFSGAALAPYYERAAKAVNASLTTAPAGP